MIECVLRPSVSTASYRDVCAKEPCHVATVRAERKSISAHSVVGKSVLNVSDVIHNITHMP